MKFLTLKFYLFLCVFLAQGLLGHIFTPIVFSAALPAPATASDVPANPETDFPVEHPQLMNTGEPFVVRLTSDRRKEGAWDELCVVWLGKRTPLTLSAPLSAAPPDARAENPEVFACILPVPLDCQEKTLPLQIVGLTPGKPEKILYASSINIAQREFAAQELSVKPAFVNPDQKNLERIKLESQKNSRILSGINKERYWQIPLTRPVPGIITGEFGLRRVFNGQPRSWHRGVDFRAAEGAAIHSCAAGRVALAENQYYSGNIVIIDHGSGVFSMYAHLSAFKVKLGDMVQAGQIIGLAGKTGRVTGPHLHFGFSALGFSVDPEPLIPDFRVTPAGAF
jgi:hypothetical protein